MRLLLIGLLLLLSSAHAADINSLRQQAILRDRDAQYQLALHYQQGQGVKADAKQAFYWMEQAAENGHTQAQLQVANAYLNGSNGVTPDQTQAIYWLTRLATQGDASAQLRLGQLYERVTELSGETQALIWYRIAGLSDPTAEQRYSQLLEQQFNHRRMKEISQRKALEGTQTTTSVSPLPKSAQIDTTQITLTQIVSGIIGAFLLLAVTLLGIAYARLKKRLKKQLSTAESISPELQPHPSEPAPIQSGTNMQQHKIKQQEQTIRKQKQQMTMLFQELKRLQQAQPKQQPQPARVENLDLACALFGFSTTAIPDIKHIKLRYKQLSKIYHPDMKGSDEEMKRLNQALKSLLAHQQKTSTQ
ncbi:Localization factor PodJL [Vibrio ruber DSM 16370]|uniref:Localization factor PodJL n=1 Tax=Vibrio ruber (strain DSM 16370 / JCM 11486 / BCRC 17186 / CECT 7878 / LMG 23124 / VR1) TaxID=1123498 RepID=A0A1R4LK15_VIBR1|nr:J domain-containing protein [Vibrio ruber]SJN56697.1 Localization factor PodJL [Vibrio ruber DSM 16370]